VSRFILVILREKKMVKISLTALSTSPEDVVAEIKHIYDSSPKEAKEDIDSGQVILDVTEITGLSAAIAVACLNGISGIMPMVLEDWSAEGYEHKETVDLHEIRQEFYLKYRSVTGGKKDGNQKE